MDPTWISISEGKEGEIVIFIVYIPYIYAYIPYIIKYYLVIEKYTSYNMDALLKHYV